jgi:hypothetical protein
MKQFSASHMIATCVTLTLLAGCGGSQSQIAAGAFAVAPAANPIVPAIRTVDVSAIKGGSPVSGLEISLRRSSWPGGKLIAKGKTGPKGHVKLSGDWTSKDLICVGGTLQTASGTITRYHCETNFPAAYTLRF